MKLRCSARALRHAALLGALLSCPLRAAAFSDYELFSLPPLEGGGGHRYFTGSSSDGYACAVCHLGGVDPIIQVSGLPSAEYLPGTPYDVLVAWRNPQFIHALNLEFVTPQGLAAGTITLPDPATLQPQDLCDAAHGGEVAAHLIEESLPRQVLSLNGCGAQRVRFRFTPSADTQLMFAASVVRSDDNEKPDGDGTAELRRTLYRQGLAPSSSGCSVVRTSRDQLLVRNSVFLAALALLLRQFARARTRALRGRARPTSMKVEAE